MVKRKGKKEKTFMKKTGQFFRDGKSQIDAILVYENAQENLDRVMFLAKLVHQGLSIEEEVGLNNESLSYVKIHASTAVLKKYAQKYAIPVKFTQLTVLPEPTVYLDCMKTILTDPEPDIEDPVHYRAIETISKVQPTEFTSAERSAIVFSIMEYTKFSQAAFSIGLPQLLHKNVFTAAFSLHEGDWKWPENEEEPLNDRQLLARYWADFRKWYKQQPLNVIQKYFGHDIAMYFAWLGFYNKMLMIASVVGILFFFFGIISNYTIVSAPLEEVCDSEVDLCPFCYHCKSQKLKDFCTQFKYAYINDNLGTVIFAFFMSLWATLFMELWKREEATLNVRWNANTESEFPPRPQFQADAVGIRMHKYTNEIEQYVPVTEKIWHHSISVAVVTLMLFVVLGTLLAIILFEWGLKRLGVKGYGISIISSILTLFVMMALRGFYGNIANWLTTAEIPRTQEQYDKSFMLKMIIFSIVNSYGKLIYLAFFKGKFFTYPGDPELRASYFPLMSDRCNPTGCIFDMFVLLAVIIIIKPTIMNFIELGSPMIKVWMHGKKQESSLPSWEKDYNLIPSNNFSIMAEFEEMIIQYGFVTLVVAVFPLAPLFALVNNILEVRLDSSKMVKYFRRPSSRRMSGVQVWFDTLQAITYLAIITNALFISFTSSFIPEAVYYYDYSNHTLKGFVDFTLSEYKEENHWWPNSDVINCWYSGFRHPPGHPKQYELTFTHYYILSARLGFGIIFAVFVLGFTGIIAYAIPDIPSSIKDLLAYNAKITRDTT